MVKTDTEDTVFIFTPRDISGVQGQTEAYYITRHFSKNYRTHIFAPLSEPFEGAVNHDHRFNGMLGVFFLNVLFLPYILFLGMRHRPDIVFCYQEIIIPPFVLRRIFGSKVVYDLQSDPYAQGKEFKGNNLLNASFLTSLKLSQMAHKWALPRADLTFVLSDPLMKDIHQIYGVPMNKLEKLPLGVDVDTFDFHFREGSKDLNLIYIGTISNRRGIEVIVDGVLGLPREQRERVNLFLVGGGDEQYMQSLEERGKSQGWDGVHTLGYFPHEEVPEIARRCDVGLSPLPPLDAYEVSCPAKLFEYLALGLPILASDISPHRAYLESGKDAFFFDPDDSGEVSNILEELLGGREKLRAMSQAAREKSLDHSWESRFETIENQLESI